MEVKKQELELLIQNLVTFEKMYEITRVVDPVGKKVVYMKEKDGKELAESIETCYTTWGRGEMCKNCISLRAYNENQTFIKIDTSTERIMMVTAIPIKVGEATVVVEFLKNVTRSMILDDVKLSDGMEIKRLLDQANIAVVTDELTKIYNKRYILEKLPVDLSISQLEQQSLALLMTDIDHFKIVNDTYGHLAGDYILKELAEILRTSIRSDKDWTARFGGEEFLVCLTQTDLHTARKIAERMRKSIEERTFSFDGKEIQLTSSFGICMVNGEENMDYETLIRCADNKLYEAKKAGRNCVIG